LALLKQIFLWFDISTELVIASEHSFQGKKSDLILDHGLRFNAGVIVTGILGKDYIEEESFRAKGIGVVYQDYQFPVYKQKFGEFISHLSFVDLLFNHGPESRNICLKNNITKKEICKIVSV